MGVSIVVVELTYNDVSLKLHKDLVNELIFTKVSELQNQMHFEVFVIETLCQSNKDSKYRG